MDEGHDFAKILGGEKIENNLDPETLDLSSQGQKNTEDSKESNVEQKNETPVENQDSDKNSSLNDENLAPQQSKLEIQEDDVLSYLSEKLGRNIDSLDSLNKPAEPNNPFASEQLKALNDYVKDTGRDVKDYFRAQAIDLENANDESVLKQFIKYNNPDFTSKEVDLFFKHNYKQDSNKYDEDESAMGSLQMKKDVREAKKLFEQVKQSYYSKAKSNEMSDSQVQEVRKNFISAMESEVDDLDGVSFEINDKGETFTFSMTDKAREELKNSNRNLDNFFTKYVQEDGTWDYDSLNQDMFILNNIEDIVRGVANQYRSKGTEQVIKEAKNVNLDSKEQPLKSNSKSVEQQLADAIFKNSTQWNR